MHFFFFFFHFFFLPDVRPSLFLFLPLAESPLKLNSFPKAWDTWNQSFFFIKKQKKKCRYFQYTRLAPIHFGGLLKFPHFPCNSWCYGLWIGIKYKFGTFWTPCRTSLGRILMLEVQSSLGNWLETDLYHEICTNSWISPLHGDKFYQSEPRISNTVSTLRL